MHDCIYHCKKEIVILIELFEFQMSEARAKLVCVAREFIKNVKNTLSIT